MLNEDTHTSEAAKSFTARKLDWINRIVSDRRLTLFQRVVGVALSFYFNADSSDCYVSQKKLAERVGGTVRAVQMAIDALVAAGLLAVQVGAGKNSTNTYRMLDGLEAFSQLEEAQPHEPPFVPPARPYAHPPESPFVPPLNGDSYPLRTGIRTPLNRHSYKHLCLTPVQRTPVQRTPVRKIYRSLASKGIYKAHNCQPSLSPKSASRTGGRSIPRKSPRLRLLKPTIKSSGHVKRQNLNYSPASPAIRASAETKIRNTPSTRQPG
jgi:hypothetical protein